MSPGRQKQTLTLCHADKHSFLLKFKESFTIDKLASSSPFAYLKVASWTREGDQNQGNCCSWDGVECHAESSRVVGLDLKSSCLYGSINSNNTLFRLVHLNMLDLLDNNFNSSEVPSRLGYDLLSLSYLNLSWSEFSGQIPSEISKLTKLSTLDLFHNNGLELKKSNMRILVQNLTSIKQLHLSDVGIYSTMPDILVNASSFTSLNLSYCGLNGEFPVGIFHLPNLEELSLGSNIDLNGYFPTFNRTNSFKTLDVSWTNFSGGNFPRFVANLTHLAYLDLGDNSITGEIPSWLGLESTQLTHLLLAYIDLQGAVPKSFFHLRKLKGLDLSYNRLSVRVKFSLSATLPKFEVLRLAECNLTEFPEFLKNQYELGALELSGNNIHGQIPKWLWNATRETLVNLDLDFNFLTGFEENPVTLPWKNLQLFNLKNNRLQGSLPIPPPVAEPGILPQGVVV
ncbi:receptor-like protein 7 [Malus sylvestris]|uniref:receptor-like protein 7 n=1 Tax=Malus sylvestris TaxID=3752 RepID=UPI0021AC27CC|nr:receptor-like protein 7 [Malus sylvestris]